MRSASSTPLGRTLARRAARLVGHRSLRDVSRAFPDDCSGLVRYVYSGAGIDLLAPTGHTGRRAAGGGSLSAELYRRARDRRLLRARPRPGDLVFFRDTYDRNRDGRRDDGITHVGLVESVTSAGEVTFVHRLGSGIVRSKLDRRHPRLRRDGRHQVRNDVLRRQTSTDRAYLTGELLVGFARPPPRTFGRRKAGASG